MVAESSFGSPIFLLWVRVLLRFIQFTASMVAFISLPNVSYHNTAEDQTGVVMNSGAIRFALIVNFLTFLYAFAFLVFIEWLRFTHPANYSEKWLDMMLLIALTVSTLGLFFPGVSLHCRSVYSRFVRCGQLYLVLAMSFLSMLAFLCAMFVGKRAEDDRRSGGRAAQGDRGSEAYSSHKTPRGGATPVPIVCSKPMQA